MHVNIPRFEAKQNRFEFENPHVCMFSLRRQSRFLCYLKEHQRKAQPIKIKSIWIFPLHWHLSYENGLHTDMHQNKNAPQTHHTEWTERIGRMPFQNEQNWIGIDSEASAGIEREKRITNTSNV